MTTTELESPPVVALSVQMQTYAQGYIDARKRAGYAWLDMGRFLSEARIEAKYGEWGVFLEATQTSEDWAKRLIAIYATSLHDRQFADAMRTNFLSVATGYELISAPPDVQARLLSGDTPPTQRQIRDEKREAGKSAAPPTLDAAPFWQSMTPNHPTAHLWTQLGMNEHRAACGMIASRAPSGSTEAGHCSSCVRATWPQSETAPTLPDLASFGLTARALPNDRIGIRAEGNLETEHTHAELNDLIAFWRAYPPIPADLVAAGVVWRYRQDRMYQVMRGDTIGQTGYTAAECLTNQRESMQRTGLLASPAESDDSAIIAEIRTQAETLGLEMIWEDGRVLLYWPDEADDLEQMDLLSYGAALEWLAGDGLRVAGLRREAMAESAPSAAPAASDRASYEAAEGIDLVLIAKAEQAITRGDTDCARDLLAQVQVATYRRDQVLATITASYGVPMASNTPPNLAYLDATLPADLLKLGYYWKSAQPISIAHNDGWISEAATADQAIEAARDREKARGAITYVTIPPFPTKAAPALMESISFLLEMIADWVPSSREKAAPALGLLRAIGRKTLEATE